MRKWLIIGGAAAVSLSAAFAALAQGAHGIPSPEKVYGDGVTWPIQIETRHYDMKALVAPETLSQDAQAGRLLFVQKCAYCHDGVGSPTYQTMGPWLGGEVVTNLGEETVKNFIKSGDVRMPAFRYNLSDEQIGHVVAYLKSVPSDQKPTARQLTGRADNNAASD